MLIEKIVAKSEELIIGISENVNANAYDTDALLEIAKAHSSLVLAFQFLNSAMIVDEFHLLSSAQNAMNAMKGGYMISRTLDVELVVYSSAQHQIGLAIDRMGVKDNLPSVAVVCIDADKTKVLQCLHEIKQQVGDEKIPMFEMTAKKKNLLMKTFRVAEKEMQQFTEATDTASSKTALSKCVVSRVSQVALNS